MSRSRSMGRPLALLAGLVLLTACSPTLDWREVRPEASGAIAMFPCKPASDSRTVLLGDVATRMTLLSCQSSGTTFALAFAELGDPNRVAPVLATLRKTLVDNVKGVSRRVGPSSVPGMTPNPLAERLQVSGQWPDGTPIQQQAGFFVKGTRVFQATVMGPKLDAEAVDVFFDGLKLPA